MKRFSSAWLCGFLFIAPLTGYGAQPIPPSVDEDLTSYGELSHFDRVVLLEMKSEKLSHWCSASKILSTITQTIYLTAAHCVDGMSSLWIGGIKASWAFVHPLYQGTPLYDLALVSHPRPSGKTIFPPYPVCATDPEAWDQAELSGVGYGLTKGRSTPRQAFRFYPDWVSPFLITQDRHPPAHASGPFGLMTHGESGGPVLLKTATDHFCIVGILTNGGAFDSTATRIPPSWKAFLTHFLKNENLKQMDQMERSDRQPYLLSAFLPFLEKPWEEMKTDLQSSPDFQYFLACGYDREGNNSQAFDLFLKAAQQGHAAAMYNVANMLFNGEGVTQNKTLSRQWFEKAAHNGDQDAFYRLKRLDGIPSEQQLP